jgi:hypothetical protein
MREHLERWQSLTLSPADRAILDQMEEEHGRLRDPGADGRSPARVLDRSGLDVAIERRHVSKDAPCWHNSRGAARLLVWEIGRPNLQGAKSTPQG